jgi:apolipoprotein N-acyltransferase
MFISGFFISILWFWWIGYSFVYYDLSYLIAFILFAIGFIYGALFYLVAVFQNIYIRAIFLFCLTFIYPFGFNWLQLELPFINSYLGTSKLDFALILLSLIFIIKFHSYKKYLSLLPIVFAFNYQTAEIKMPNLKIYLANTQIPQEQKWNKKYKDSIINNNMQIINKAIKEKYDLVILPETSFPLLLNTSDKLMKSLKQKSKQISIVTGSLFYENNQYHNSTYLFQDGLVQNANKVVLIPFGEAVPLPQLLRDMINNLFYNGAKDYQCAKSPTTFEIKGVKFRNAICYEATRAEIYENLDTTYLIAISNSAWFVPSIQPTLQNLLLKYYAKKYKVKIFHSINMPHI